MAKTKATAGATSATKAKRHRQPSARAVLAMDTAQILAALRRTMSTRAIESAANVNRAVLSRIESGERRGASAETYRSLALLAIEKKVI